MAPVLLLLDLILLLLLGRATCAHKGPKAHRAPLLSMDHEGRINDFYLVFFNKAHSLDGHWRTIGTNLSASQAFEHFEHLNGYAVKMVSLLPPSDPSVPDGF